jgi:hypothetical protein
MIISLKKLLYQMNSIINNLYHYINYKLFKYNQTTHKKSSRRVSFSLKTYHINRKSNLPTNSAKVNFFFSTFFRVFFIFLPNFLFILFWVFRPSGYLSFFWNKFNSFYSLPLYQRCLILFIVYRKNLIFSFRKLLPLIGKKTNKLVKLPFSKKFFLAFLNYAVFIRYFETPKNYFFNWRPFYVWKTSSSIYSKGPVWKIKNSNFFLFYFLAFRFLSRQNRFFSKNLFCSALVNVGSLKDIQTNKAVYYYFWFMFLKTPAYYVLKKKYNHWVSKNWLFFVPHHNILPLSKISTTPYIFKYASHKSISTPIRAYE